MAALLPLYFSSFFVALSGALMPGPLFAATISESMKRGPSVGPKIISGHALLEGVLVVGLMLGFAPFLQKDVFTIFISFAGSILLFWMALGMFRGLPDLEVNWQGKSAKEGNLMAAGMLLSVTNPYWIIWWATIGLSFMIHAQKAGAWGVIVFYLGHETADVVWFSFLSAAVGKGRHLMSDRMYRIIIGSAAVILCGFAVFFGWTGMEKFLKMI